MKKVIAIMCLGMLTFNITAQVKGGVKLGTTFANIANSELIDYKTKVGLQTGGFIVFEIGDVFQIRPELIYTQKGASYYNYSTLYNLNPRIVLNYLEMPIFFGFNIAGSGFCINTGPYLALLLSAKEKIDANPYGVTGSNLYDECNPIDIGLNFGCSYTIAEHFVIDSRYGIGLINIPDYDYFNDDIWLNSVLSLSFGYQF